MTSRFGKDSVKGSSPSSRLNSLIFKCFSDRDEGRSTFLQVEWLLACHTCRDVRDSKRSGWPVGRWVEGEDQREGIQSTRIDLDCTWFNLESRTLVKPPTARKATKLGSPRSIDSKKTWTSGVSWPANPDGWMLMAWIDGSEDRIVSVICFHLWGFSCCHCWSWSFRTNETSSKVDPLFSSNCLTTAWIVASVLRDIQDSRQQNSCNSLNSPLLILTWGWKCFYNCPLNQKQRNLTFLQKKIEGGEFDAMVWRRREHISLQLLDVTSQFFNSIQFDLLLSFKLLFRNAISKSALDKTSQKSGCWNMKSFQELPSSPIPFESPIKILRRWTSNHSQFLDWSIGLIGSLSLARLGNWGHQERWRITSRGGWQLGLWGWDEERIHCKKRKIRWRGRKHVRRERGKFRSCEE